MQAEILLKVVEALAILLGLYLTARNIMSPISQNLKELNFSIVQNVESLKRLNEHIEQVTERVKCNEQTNTESHRRLWNKTEEIDSTLNEHDKRITLLEHKN